MSTGIELLLLTLTWLVYFLVHSILASVWAKNLVARYLPRVMPWYRLLFNLQALVLIMAPLIMLFRYRSDPLWQWQGVMAGLAYSLMVLSVAGFVWSMRFYDSREFLGFRQLRRHQQEINDLEQLHISPLHRFVRHPWYSLGLLLIWVQDMDPARLISAICITGYLILGSRLEERKLLLYHGDLYRYYRQRVPGLIPRPWRFLSRYERERLVKEIESRIQ